MSAIVIREGRSNFGRGLGVSELRPIRSAMKAAFSMLFGLTKTEKVRECGIS